MECIPAGDVRHIGPVMTMVGGKVVYQSGD
jgi:hypothetical protein